MADDTGKEPLEVRVTALPEAFTALVQTLADRLTAMEAREKEMQKAISALENRVKSLARGGGGLMSAGNPTAERGASGSDPNTKSVDAGAFAQALGAQILEGSDENSDFMIDDVSVEILGGLGQDGDRAQIATNPGHQATSQAASKIAFSIKRRRPTQIIE